MSDRRYQDLSVEELQQLLHLKKRAQRQERLRRLKAEGRVVEIDGLEPPLTEIEVDSRLNPTATGGDLAPQEIPATATPQQGRLRWRWLANKLLLVIEVLAVVGLLVIAYIAWSTTRELNQEIAEVQQVQSESVALPTATATPVIGSVVLPSGHKPPVNGRPPEPGEAGDIPAHLLPILDAYVPPPIPTPGPEQARRLEIPALNLDKPIVQGDDWEQLKKGVGQHIPSGLPGQPGNLVLSAHNDIYGEIFRHLDKLKAGDEVVISTERRSYTYVVRELEVVAPTEVSVMGPTEHASVTLISCYPYLVNNKRIVVFADLAATGPLSNRSS
ncbi:MAG: sortase [Chloroflexota bacterium]|jgi:sortase A